LLHFKIDNSNVTIERKCRGSSRGAWTLKNAEKIKNLFGLNRRGNNQGKKGLGNQGESRREFDPKAE